MLVRMLVSIWLVPPALNILLMVCGFIVSRWYFRFGALISLCGLVSLWLLATPFISSVLHASIERYPALKMEEMGETSPLGNAQAIVVLGAAHFDLAKEYGVSTPTDEGLVRLHYAANLYGKTELPIMLTGGPMNQRQEIHSEVLGESLNSQFGIEPKWLERKSKTTWQNALFGAEILHPIGVTSIVLVTHSYHMLRAVELFELAGFNVIAAPTQFSSSFAWKNWRYWMPQTEALHLSSKVLHEYLGVAWYQLVPPVGNDSERDLGLYAQ